MKSELKISAKDKITKSINCMVTDYGFFASLLLQMEVIEDNDQPTMCTDGKRIMFNSKFVEKLQQGEVSFVLMHEVMHCAMGHLWRRDGRIFPLWNIATDFAINALINEVSSACYDDLKRRFGQYGESLAHKIVMPKDVLFDEKYAGKCAEEIYSEIKKNAKIQYSNQSGSQNGTGDKQNNSGNSNGSDGDSEDENQNNGGNGSKGKSKKKNKPNSGNNGESAVVSIGKHNIKAPSNHETWKKADNASENEKRANEIDWQGKLLVANETLKQQGVCVAGIQMAVAKITHPQKNWKTLLQEFVQEEVNDYSLMPPDRRFDGDFFMFDFNDKTEVVKDVLFFVDTSGSMGEREINVCYSEIQGAINQFEKNLHGTLLFFDSDVSSHYYNFDDTNGDISKLSPFGGGGTSYECIFDFVNNNRDKFTDINGIIILTDGYCDYPEEKITNGIPVLWIYTTSNNKPPFGRSTELTLDEE